VTVSSFVSSGVAALDLSEFSVRRSFGLLLAMLAYVSMLLAGASFLGGFLLCGGWSWGSGGARKGISTGSIVFGIIRAIDVDVGRFLLFGRWAQRTLGEIDLAQDALRRTRGSSAVVGRSASVSSCCYTVRVRLPSALVR
jgi:hypothetical protein